MNIQHKQSGTKGAFFIGGDNELLAEMVYTMAGEDKLIIEHTEVSEELRGQNVGAQLVEKAVEYARLHQLKIIPVCPFANAVFKKRADYKDVLFQ